MKVARHAKILELVQNNDIETQEQLADLLMKAGYDVTQATISRDIRELKLSKVSDGNGRQKYAEIQKQQIEDVYLDKYVQILQNGFVSIDRAINIIVIKTVPGMAMAVAAAVDAMRFDGVVGCIAGDDTIMCAIRTVKETEYIMSRIKRLTNSDK